MTENRGDFGSAGEAGESVYGENADMPPPGDGTSGDSSAMVDVGSVNLSDDGNGNPTATGPVPGAGRLDVNQTARLSRPGQCDGVAAREGESDEHRAGW